MIHDYKFRIKIDRKGRKMTTWHRLCISMFLNGDAELFARAHKGFFIHHGDHQDLLVLALSMGMKPESLLCSTDVPQSNFPLFKGKIVE